jgi:hypothetical protein
LKEVREHQLFRSTAESAVAPSLKERCPNDVVYETTIGKSRIRQTVPIQIGFMILQYAKLRMLEFYYDCLKKYYNSKEFQLMHMDTDSFYLAVSKDLYGKLTDKNIQLPEKWFPSRDGVTKITIPGTTVETTPKLYDKYVPGLFKTEHGGLAEIALTCKTNYLLGETEGMNKVTFKGGQKDRNRNITNWEAYKRSLVDIKQIKGSNMGFRLTNKSGTKSMSTYYSHKTILTSIYTKAVILDDGIHIRPFTPDEVYATEEIVNQEATQRDRMADDDYLLDDCSDVDEY